MKYRDMCIHVPSLSLCSLCSRVGTALQHSCEMRRALGYAVKWKRITNCKGFYRRREIIARLVTRNIYSGRIFFHPTEKLRFSTKIICHFDLIIAFGISTIVSLLENDKHHCVLVENAEFREI